MCSIWEEENLAFHRNVRSFKQCKATERFITLYNIIYRQMSLNLHFESFSDGIMSINFWKKMVDELHWLKTMYYSRCLASAFFGSTSSSEDLQDGPWKRWSAPPTPMVPATWWWTCSCSCSSYLMSDSHFHMFLWRYFLVFLTLSILLLYLSKNKAGECLVSKEVRQWVSHGCTLGKWLSVMNKSSFS